jgi:hypothetical protein
MEKPAYEIEYQADYDMDYTTQYETGYTPSYELDYTPRETEKDTGYTSAYGLGYVPEKASRDLHSECKNAFSSFDAAEPETEYDFDDAKYGIDYTPSCKLDYYTPQETGNHSVIKSKSTFSSVTGKERETCPRDSACHNSNGWQNNDIEGVSLTPVASTKEIIIILSSDDDENNDMYH